MARTYLPAGQTRGLPRKCFFKNTPGREAFLLERRIFMETNLKRLRNVLNGNEEADLVLLNVMALDPFNVTFRMCDLTIHDGVIVALKAFPAKHVIDAQGAYASPLLVDAHMHIESTTVLPHELDRLLIPRGVGRLIADPHEIANVAGSEGIKFILDASEGLNLDVRVMLPSSVPATASEHAGAILKAEDLRPFLSHPRVCGLAEVMDKDAVYFDDDMLAKITDTHQSHKRIDGHGSNLDTDDLDLYSMLGILTDHECVDAQEALDRVQRGFYVHIREGSVTKNLQALLSAVTSLNFRQFCFCTDDKHPDDLYQHGGVDAVVRAAISQGLDPAMALTMATLHPNRCYRIEDEGAIAPGYKANFFLFEDPYHITAKTVYHHGKRIVNEGNYIDAPKRIDGIPERLLHSVHFAPLKNRSFEINLIGHRRVHVMDVLPGNVLTRLSSEIATVDRLGNYQCDPDRDLAKLAVIERHHATGNIGVCPVRGFNLRRGAIGSTVAHDSHNLVIAGTNDQDMLAAAEELHRIDGGYTVVCEGHVLASVPLEIGGLLTQRNLETTLSEWDALHAAYASICDRVDFNPFLMLSFLALPVIPEVKLTDIGLIDVATQKIVEIRVTQEEKEWIP